MNYPESKEREQRFKLALRMGLPTFSLAALLIYISLSEFFNTIPPAFYIIAILVLAVLIYFNFYLIYRGIDERITDPISKTFTREYLAKLLSKSLKKGPYTVILISVDNLNDINSRYGTNNGDKVLRVVAERINSYLLDKGFSKYPIGHFKGGDFIIGFEGDKFTHKAVLELMCLKFERDNVDEIEVKISGAIVDSNVSTNLEHLIERLFEVQDENRKMRNDEEEAGEFNPTEIESKVLEAINKKQFSLMYQEVFHNNRVEIYDTSVKLIASSGKYIHQSSYMPVITRMGLERDFDRVILESIVKVCQEDSTNTIFALNIAPSTLRNQNFYDKVQLLFSNNNLIAGRIAFVISEREYYNHIDTFNDLLQAYRRMGVFIVLDNFGTNHTSLLYLRELDVDMVRFDGSYGKQLHQKSYESLLRGFNVAAQSMGVKSWIRMLENEPSYISTKNMNIDYAQGNYLGKIAPLENKQEIL